MRPRLGKVRLVGLVRVWSSFHSYHFASFMNIFILEFTEPIWSLYGLDVSEITTSKESFKSRAIFLFFRRLSGTMLPKPGPREPWSLNFLHALYFRLKQACIWPDLTNSFSWYLDTYIRSVNTVAVLTVMEVLYVYWVHHVLFNQLHH